MEAFYTVAFQVGVMLILIFTGVLASKSGKFSDQGAKDCTWLLMNVVTPCLIINSFASVESGDISTKSLVLALVCSTLSLGVAIGVSFLLFKKESIERKKVLRYSIVFSNAGFMGMPLVTALLGVNGVIFASFYIAVFNFFNWTFGYSMMSGGKKVRLFKILVNPGTIGLAFGLPIYLLDLNVPNLILQPIEIFSYLNTPIAMLVVGTYIAKMKVKDFINDKSVYKIAVFRLIVCPLILIAVLLLIKPEYNLFVSTVIQGSAPVAASTVLFAIMFGADAKLASKNVAISTLLSVITMPLVMLLAQILAENLL